MARFAPPARDTEKTVVTGRMVATNENVMKGYTARHREIPKLIPRGEAELYKLHKPRGEAELFM